MFERFTDSARAAVVNAQEQARGLHHDEVLAEHLLLAVLAEQACISAHVLREHGVHMQRLTSEVAALGRGDHDALREIGIDLALEQSLRQALALRHHHIGVDHLLLGLLADDHDPAARTLQRLGVVPADIRAQVQARLQRAA